ncbi:hypothetical protein BDR04DRAFT_1229932 [Suillus decipiens]|nr:hypothetical protein BDR04DRAFT_1229932 [Suillus decipiens]
MFCTGETSTSTPPWVSAPAQGIGKIELTKVKNAMAMSSVLLPCKDVLACIEFKRKADMKEPIKPLHSGHSSHKAEDPAPGPLQTPATQPASDTALVLSCLTAVQHSKGGLSSKRKAADTLEDAAKKTRINPDGSDVTVQTVAVSLTVIDDVMSIWYRDRHGTIQSSGINFIQDPLRFVVRSYALQRFELEDWDRNKDVLPVQVQGRRYDEFKMKGKEMDILLHPEPTTDSRKLCILVFRKLRPIMKLHGKELFDVWYQCILSHVTLWKQGVFHRDVCPDNLMWYWKDGKRVGVLNDYDLSSLADDPAPRGNGRTCARPFMALELLSPQGRRSDAKHLYRHDLESFMWCFAWICLRYENGTLLPGRLNDWTTSGAGTHKLYFLYNLGEYRFPHIKSFMWRFLVACFGVLDAHIFNRRKQLRSAERADKPANFEESESDIDDFLQSFKNTESWAALSEPAQESLR